MEEFKNGLRKELKCYVEESVRELVILADEYTLTQRKSKFLRYVRRANYTSRGTNDNTPTVGRELRQVTCYYFEKVGHISTNCRSRQNDRKNHRISASQRAQYRQKDYQLDINHLYPRVNYHKWKTIAVNHTSGAVGCNVSYCGVICWRVWIQRPAAESI